MKNIMNKDVAFRTEIVQAIRAPISAKRTHPFVHGSSCGCRWRREWPKTAMTRQTSVVHNLVLRKYCFVSFYWKQMMVASRQMGGAHDHQPADITIGRHFTHFSQTARTEEALSFDLGVADTKTRGRGIWEASRKSHHHKIRTRIRCACGRAVISTNLSMRLGRDLLHRRSDQFE